MNSVFMAAKIARRELRGGVRGFKVFLACLALGVAAIAAIGLVRSSIEAGLTSEGAAILGGDASVRLTYRFATTDEQAWMAGVAGEVSEIVDFRSMLVAQTADVIERGLTQVKAVDNAYPLYGRVRLVPEMALQDALAGNGTLPGAVIDRVLLDRLGLEVGDTARLGQTDFVVMAALAFAPDEAASGFSLGPRTIVAKQALEGSGLLQPGTLFETIYRLKLPPDTNLTGLKAQAAEVLDGSGFRWRDRRNGAPGISRFVDRLSAFLVLVGLTGLAVGGVGVAAAVRAYLDEKTAVIATLRSLGANGRTIFLTYIFQIGALTLLGVVLGLALGIAATFTLAPLIEARLPLPVSFGLRAGPLAEAALYGILSAALFTLWPLARSEDIKAAALFRDIHGSVRGRPRLVWVIATGAILAALIGSAAYFSGLVALTLWAAAGIFAAFVTLMLAASGTRHLARKLAKLPALQGRTTLRSALGAVGGPGGDATSVILSLGLGLTVLAAVGQIDWNLRNAIDRDLPDRAPAYFVVDIQNDQLAGLKAQLAANDAVSKVESAPMLRGVISKINGRPARETGGDHWVLTGDRGITYSVEPSENTVITAGKWWDADYAGAPQISFAAEEAEEMGLGLGDEMTINVLGRDITATITSFREVDFSTAGIGFILTMNPGALQGAPHTHIATIYAAPEAEAGILRDIAVAYPNITAIRVRDAIERVSTILAGIAAAITYGAFAALLTGGVVLIGTAAVGERARVYEGAILKTLGASRAAIVTNFAIRSAYLGLTASIIAIFAGGTAGWAVTTFVMETDFEFEWRSAAAIVFGGLLITLLTGLFFSWRPLSARPAQVLRARE